MKKAVPIFQSIFGKQWFLLPPVMHRHYSNRPYCDDEVAINGKMDIEFGWLVKLLTPFLRIFGTLVPHQGRDIPVTVRFRSERDSAAFCLERTFNFNNRKSYIFFSKMVQIKDDVVVEWMKFGMGWKHRYYYDGKKVILEHRGYVWKIFGMVIPIPLGLLLGKGYAEEKSLGLNSFRMKMYIIHPLFGKIYEYRGVFEVK